VGVRQDGPVERGAPIRKISKEVVGDDLGGETLGHRSPKIDGGEKPKKRNVFGRGRALDFHIKMCDE